MSSTQGYDPALLRRRHELDALAKRRSNRIAAVKPCFPKGLSSDRVTKKQQQAWVNRTSTAEKASVKRSNSGEVKKPSTSSDEAKIEHVEQSDPFEYIELYDCHLQLMDKVRRRLRRALTYVTNVCSTKRAKLIRLFQLKNTLSMAQMDIYFIKEEFIRPEEEA